MPEASSSNADFSPAGTPSEAADVRQDIWSLTPEEAGQVLAERAADFAPQPLTAEQVQDATDARIRLSQLTNDPAWAKRFMEGNPAERREFEALTAMIANAADETTPFVQAPAETTLGDQSARRQDLISVISHHGKLGLPVENIEKTLTGDWTAEDVEYAQACLDQGFATKEWVDGLLRGDPVCVREWTGLCGALSVKAR
jgi:hypothetical protein